MSFLIAIISVLVPILCFVLIGAVLKFRYGSADYRALDVVSYRIFIPALLFSAAASQPVALSTATSLILVTIMMVVIAFAIATLIARYSSLNPIETAGRTQTAWRFNGIIGLALAPLISMDALQALSIIIGAAVPLVNVLAIYTLSRGRSETSASGSHSSDAQLSFRKVARDIALNPFFLSSVGGLVVSGVGLSVPDWMDSFIAVLAGCAIPVSLIAVGTSLSWGHLILLDRHIVLLHLIKLIILPGLALTLAMLLSQPKPSMAAILIAAALPTAASSHILASEFGARREGVAAIASQSTLLSLLSLPAWLLLFSVYFSSI